MAENKNKGLFKILLIVGILVFIVVLVIFLTKKEDSDSIFNWWDKDVNYSYFLEASWEMVKGEEKEDLFDLNIKDWKMLSQEKWLKQRFQFWEINFKTNLMEEVVNIKDVDLVSDNEKLYAFVWEWMDNIPDDVLSWTDSITKRIVSHLDNMKGSFKDGKYVMVDNSKPLLKVFWKLANDELVKELIIWAVTSNPMEYYKKHKTNEKLNNYLLSSKFLDDLFEEDRGVEIKYIWS